VIGVLVARHDYIDQSFDDEKGNKKSLASFESEQVGIAVSPGGATTTIAQDPAYSYRVWTTLIKLFYEPLQHHRIGLNIHQGERLCGRLPHLLP
jgi:hypothetical protein